MSETPPVPPPPPLTEWTFVDELARHERVRANWDLPTPPTGFADLVGGVRVVPAFPDEGGVLATAYADLLRFLADVGLGDGPYEIATRLAPTERFEAFRLHTLPDRCVIEAADSEGVRRGIYFLRDELRRSRHPGLPLGTTCRRPHVHTRISRCCYGPKNRPGNYATKPGMPGSIEEVFGTPEYERWRDEPEMRDELFDDREYFPDAYLSRLAGEGVNGLWVTGMFWQLCRTAAFPGFGPHSERRMDHLRRIVARCARYGIKVYLFCIEPRAAGDRNLSVEIPAAVRGHQNRMYCTSTPQGRQGLAECVRFLFAECPGLGGLINLCVGERGTHCYSASLTTPNTCPRCRLRDPFDVLSETLAIMETAMHEVAPQAQLIAWPYSQYLVWGSERTRGYASHLPERVVLMHNFESAGQCEQLGRMRTLNDYWLAWPGPSQLFRDCAENARAAGRETGAKIQAGCSYEMATVPFVPVPGNLWRKYRAIRELGVQTVMQCWLIGSFPSVMTRAAGELSFEPFPEDEDAFLERLAARDWAGHERQVASAWRIFGEAYRNYPFSRIFSYYSPMNNGPVWPLHLVPRDLGLQAPFRAGRPPSGDRIGECLGDDLTLAEALVLVGRMRDGWERGTALLAPLREAYRDHPARLRDIAVCEAVGLLIQSAAHILQFYQWREELAWSEDIAVRCGILDRMRRLVAAEIQVSQRLLVHAEADSRLGFQADSECHIYYPEKLRWRIGILGKLEDNEFAPVERAVHGGGDPFASYTGRQPEGPVLHCRRRDGALRLDGRLEGEQWLACEAVALAACDPPQAPEAAGRATTLRACWDEEGLYLGFVCHEPDMGALRTEAGDNEPILPADNDMVQIGIEPQRLWPARRIMVSASGARYHVAPEYSPDYAWQAACFHGADFWSLTVRLPWSWLLPDGVFAARPCRILVQRHVPARPRALRLSWPCVPNYLPHRLMLSSENPADLGWAILDAASLP